MRLFLFPASEEPYTPEDAAAAAAAHEALLASAVAGSADRALREALRDGASLARAFARVSGSAGPPAATPGGGSAAAATPSSALSSAYSSGSAALGEASAAAEDGASQVGQDGAATPSAGDTELAWEAGFRAGQEAAARAAEEEWQAFLLRRMAELSRSKSQQMLGGATAEWHAEVAMRGAAKRVAAAAAGGAGWSLSPAVHPASLLGLPESSAMLHMGSGGDDEEEDEAEEAAVAAELAAAGAAGDALAGAAAAAMVSRALATPLPATVPPSLVPSAPASAQASPQRSTRSGGPRRSPAVDAPAPAVSLTMADAEEEGGPGRDEPDEEFEAMFESKYERAASPALGGGSSGARAAVAASAAAPAPLPAGAATAKAAMLAAGGGGGNGRAALPDSPDSLLPKHISVFGEGLGGGDAGPTLPSHISAFGGEGGGDGPAAVLSVLKAALPEGELGPERMPAPPQSLQLPTSFELLAGAVEGLSPGPSPRPTPDAGGSGRAGTGAGALPAQPSDLHRSPSIEALLSKVQRVEASQVGPCSVCVAGGGVWGPRPWPPFRAPLRAPERC